MHPKLKKYLHQKIANEHSYRKRLATTNNVLNEPNYRLELTNNSFRWRSAKLWNQIPNEIKMIDKVGSFKKKLKDWVVKNIDI